jgi:16S rRNA (guanine527-N7)-methyltransferase
MTSAGDGVVARRLAELCRRHGLSAAQGGQLRCLLEVVASDPHAPTSVTDPAAAVDVHLADSLAALEVPEVRAARTIADIGSGPGFPGLALAVALPSSSVTLVESAARKCEFIEHDLVTARAVAPLAVLCEYAAPLLRIGGAMVAWRGRPDREQERSAVRAAAELGLEARDPVRSDPYAGSCDHHLHLYVKVMPTPARFPRRTGIASKRPLGAST